MLRRSACASLVAVLIWLQLFCVPSAHASLAELAVSIPQSNWAPSGGKSLLTGIAASGGIKYLRTPITPAQIAIILGTTAAAIGISYLQQQWFDWLEINLNLRTNTTGTGIEANAGQRIVLNNQTIQAAIDSINGTTSWPGGLSPYTSDHSGIPAGSVRYTDGVYLTQAAASAACASTYFACAYGYFDEHVTYKKLNFVRGHNLEPIVNGNRVYHLMFYDDPEDMFTAASQDTWVPASQAEIVDELQDDLNGVNGTAAQAAARALWDAAERDAAKDMAGEAAGAGAGAIAAGIGSAIDENTDQATEDAITGGGSTGEDVTESPEGQAQTIADAVRQAIKDANTPTVNPTLPSHTNTHVWDEAPSIPDRFGLFMDRIKATSFWSLPASMSTGFPAGGSSVISFNGGIFGNQSLDFANWSTVWLALKGIILVVCCWVGIRIATKGGGG